MAEDSLRSIQDRRSKLKERYRQLILEKTGDVELADEIYNRMTIDEVEAKIDATERK